MHATYLLILLGCLLGTAPLEFVLHVGVWVQWRRLCLAVLPVVALFGAWDIAAIHDGWWHYDPAYLAGVTLPGRLPLEELLFFVVVPVCSVLTLEAVAARRPEWRVR